MFILNKVRQAVILAAGMGTRLKPVTLETPKPLIEVNGVRMIDTIISSLHQNNINEIYIVVGYLKGKFESLLTKYPDIQLIDNPYYDTCNNISSLYVAREHLQNAIILDADQMIYNSGILNPYFDKSGYNCVWTDEYTDEWLLKVDKNNTIKECSRIGGKCGWQLYSISRWNKKDGEKLKKYLEYEFIDKKNTQIYWDDIAIFCHPEEFDLTIYEMNKLDIKEIDNLDELILLDNSYLKYKKEGKNEK